MAFDIKTIENIHHKFHTTILHMRFHTFDRSLLEYSGLCFYQITMSVVFSHEKLVCEQRTFWSNTKSSFGSKWRENIFGISQLF